MRGGVVEKTFTHVEKGVAGEREKHRSQTFELTGGRSKNLNSPKPQRVPAKKTNAGEWTKPANQQKFFSYSNVVLHFG